MTYYRILFGSGTAWLNNYVIKTEYPTTDYGALTDRLIDYLVEQGSSSIVDMDEWEWNENGTELHMKSDSSWVMYSDEFVVGGNCGDVLRHYGTFAIKETENVDENDTVIDMEV